MKAPAYMNFGRWVADCPAPGCTDARALYPTDQNGNVSDVPVPNQVCASGHAFTIDMPPTSVAAQIETALAERTSEKRKNWFPKGHPLAVATGQPHGQSVRELREEAEAGEAADAAKLAEDRAFVLSRARELDIPLEDVLAALKGT